MAKKSSDAASIEPISDATTDDSNASGDAGSAGTIAGLAIVKPGDASGASAGSGDNTGSAKRGRGRPAGSTSSKSKQKAAPVSIKGIEKILFTMHLTLAKFTGIDELEIDNEESKLLSEATVEIASHYNVAIDPKTMAWIGFAGVLGTVYGPRIGAYKLRKAMEAKPTPEKSQPPVATEKATDVPFTMNPDAWMNQ